MHSENKHPDLRVRALIDQARSNGSSEDVIRLMTPYYEKAVADEPFTNEQIVRQELGLGPMAPSRSERSITEQILRDSIEHPRPDIEEKPAPYPYFLHTTAEERENEVRERLHVPKRRSPEPR
jgi:hypothetical protein